MITTKGKETLWDKIFSNGTFYIELGYWDEDAEDENKFIKISVDSIKSHLPEEHQDKIDKVSDTRQYVKRQILVYSDDVEGTGTTAKNLKSSYESGNYLVLKHTGSEATVINAYDLLFPEIDDGSADNINNSTDDVVDQGGWGVIDAIALYQGTTLIYANQLANSITTAHAMQLRFPANDLSFTINFEEDIEGDFTDD